VRQWCIVVNFYNSFRRVVPALVVGALLVAVGCHAQVPEAGTKLSPEMARRIEIMIRGKSEIPPQYAIAFGPRTKSELPGYDQINVTFSADGNTSRPLRFLISTDGKTLAQLNTYDISQDPKLKVSAGDRPERGGAANAPVTIVLFDDLECPFCAKMHAQMFPGLLDRYKGQVRVVYRDFPLDQHPWAMRAAIDSGCLAKASSGGYWNYVDYVHAHAGDLGGEAKSLAKANDSLDKLAEDEATRQKVNAAGLTDLAACIKKQDDATVKASMKEAEALGVNATPALFINGEKLEGAVPMEYVYRMIDGALIAAGQTPPPPYLPPAATPAPAKTGN
jgi:protein-disulfide isomerase